MFGFRYTIVSYPSVKSPFSGISEDSYCCCHRATLMVYLQCGSNLFFGIQIHSAPFGGLEESRIISASSFHIVYVMIKSAAFYIKYYWRNLFISVRWSNFIQRRSYRETSPLVLFPILLFYQLIISPVFYFLDMVLLFFRISEMIWHPKSSTTCLI